MHNFKKNIVILFTLLAVLVLAVLVFFKNDLKDTLNLSAQVGGIGKIKLKPLDLNQEDLVNFTKPSIVRIYHHLAGKAIIPDFNINFKTLNLDFIPNAKPLEVPIDQYVSGSGFIINPNGYIITNAHVVSDLTIKRLLAQQVIGLSFLRLLVSPKESKQLEQTMKEKGVPIADAQQFGEEIAKNLAEKLMAKISFPISKELIVLNPSSIKEKLSDLLKDGFPAKTISLNENSFKDDKDVALIKINELNLPTLTFGDSKQVTTGNKIYVFGFPTTGQFGAKDIIEPTFTYGTINALKDSQTKEFKVFQTDAKISPGSSGGPLLNENGEIVGIITFESLASLNQGDTFAFAIPANLAQNMLRKEKIENIESDYGKYMKSGLLYLQNSRCKQALSDFSMAITINSKFLVNKYVQPYIDKCNALIASGQSIDTYFTEFKVWVTEVGLMFWIILGGGVLSIIIFLLIVFKLLRRIKEDEQQITQTNMSINKIQNTYGNPTDQTNISNSEILSYIKSCRNEGLSDESIRNELQKTGWPNAEIEAAMIYEIDSRKG